MSFDLTDLRLFLHVAEAGSITRGAERAHLALPSASERIRGLEEALGVQLLERVRRGVRQTPAGRALAHHARVVLRQIEQLRGEPGDYAHGLKGHVRLLANTAAISEFLPGALGTFYRVSGGELRSPRAVLRSQALG
jgi:DNA-binding transcriptional LysR family regulator